MQTSLPASSRCVCVRVATVFVVAEEGVNEHQKVKIIYSDFFPDDKQWRIKTKIFRWRKFGVGHRFSATAAAAVAATETDLWSKQQLISKTEIEVSQKRDIRPKHFFGHFFRLIDRIQILGFVVLAQVIEPLKKFFLLSFISETFVIRKEEEGRRRLLCCLCCQKRRSDLDKQINQGKATTLTW